MEILVWVGAVVTLIGFGGILWSMLAVVRAKRAGLDDAGLRARLNRILPLNLGALFVSVIGLMLVVTGILLA